MSPYYQRSNTDWLRDARWGVFMHYLSDLPGIAGPDGISTADQWNHQIDHFDVQGLAGQLETVGAGYFFITIGQNSGFYLSPNQTYNDLVGRKPSRLSQRDLVADLADALAPCGIRLMVYLPSHAPAKDRQVVEGLVCTPEWDASCWGIRPGPYLRTRETDERLSEFQRNWEAILREWSLRWGKKVHGWWIDGCYQAERMYRSKDHPNFESFVLALKAGNPESLVAFNPGVMLPVICHTEYEDYTAGELDRAFPALMDQPWHRQLNDRFVDGSQYHVLSYLGHWWGGAPLRFSDPFVVGFTQDINACQGVVTWDVPPLPDGRIFPPALEQLKALRRATRPVASAAS